MRNAVHRLVERELLADYDQHGKPVTWTYKAGGTRRLVQLTPQPVFQGLSFILTTSYEHQRHLWGREVQHAEQISLQCREFWKSPELTAVCKAQQNDRIAGKGFEQRPPRELTLGLTHQIFQQAVDYLPRVRSSVSASS